MSRTTVPLPVADAPIAARLRLSVLLGTHTVTDVFAAFVAPLLGVLEVRCHLRPDQAAWLLGIGSLASGASQPLAAWLCDRFDTRLPGALGLLLAAVCLSCIGMADSFGSLIVIYALGMFGVGIYHPVAAASAGNMAEMVPGWSRSLCVSFFFVAGMAGGIIGSLLSPWITSLPDGFQTLRLVMIPGIVAAALFQVAVARLSHRHNPVPTAVPSVSQVVGPWREILLLYGGNVIRFTVNMALLFLFVRWAQRPYLLSHPDWSAAQIAEAAAGLNGWLNAMLVLGMAIGGLGAGALIRSGREKWPLVLTPLLLAPTIAGFPFAGPLAGCFLSVAAGIAFASMIPVSISLSQRLLPHRTSMASGLMLGGAWTFAFLGPNLAERCTDRFGLDVAFFATAGLLGLAGVVCMPLKIEE